jgi:hypothetical protein
MPDLPNFAASGRSDPGCRKPTGIRRRAGDYAFRETTRIGQPSPKTNKHTHQKIITGRRQTVPDPGRLASAFST